MSIAAAYAQPCTNVTGGGVTVWLTDKANVVSFTLSGSEYISASMLAGTAVFYKYEFEQDTAVIRMNPSKEGRSSSTVDIELEFFMSKLSTTLRDAVQSIIDASVCGMVAIVLDANNQKWVLGYNEAPMLLERPLKLRSGEGTTGAAFTDDNGMSVVIGTTHTALPRIYSGTVPV